MTIDTKYNIGDEVWVNCLGDPIPFKVKSVNIHKDRFHSFIFYDLLEDGESAFIRLQEDELFPTKEELVNHLK